MLPRRLLPHIVDSRRLCDGLRVQGHQPSPQDRLGIDGVRVVKARIQGRDLHVDRSGTLAADHRCGGSATDHEVRQHVGRAERIRCPSIGKENDHAFRKTKVVRSSRSTHSDHLARPPMTHEMPVVSDHHLRQLALRTHLGEVLIVAESFVEGEVEKIVNGLDSRVEAGSGDTDATCRRPDGESTQPPFIEKRHGDAGDLIDVDRSRSVHGSAVVPVAHTTRLSELCSPQYPNYVSLVNMLDALLLPLHNNRVRLRAMRPEDAAAYATGTTDTLVRSYAHLPEPEYTEASVTGLIEGEIHDGLERGDLAVLTIADPATDAFVGSMVLFGATEASIEVGFWMHPAYRGRGLTGAALALAAEFARRSGFTRLTARTLSENRASQQVLEQAGFTKGDEVRDIAPSGQETTLIHYDYALATPDPTRPPDSSP